ncbi:MAG TPA: NUDIX domain-containing protein [Aggregatilineaceae bacterium]|nr:NUDIX domain-containing protein [Aggregatilineaceae bacterium]
MKSRNEVSAGGVVYRRSGKTYEVLIGKDAGYHRWVLPKGLVSKDEALETAALREVQEEVGVKAHVMASMGEPERYIYVSHGMRVFKSVYYFLMEYEAGSEMEHDAEMEEVRWATFEEALNLLAYEGAQKMLQRAQHMLKAD